MNSNQTQSNNTAPVPRPGFSAVEKWLIMLAIIIGLASVVAWFNVRTFGYADGLPYLAVLGFVVLVSLLTTRHIKRYPVTVAFVRSAFVFEVLLAVILGVNAAYSLSTVREMSVAGQAEERLQANIEAASKLKSPAAQRRALRLVEGQGEVKSKAQVFAQVERRLFWIMIAELGIAMLAAFVLLGLSVFDQDGNGVPDFLESRQARPQAKQEATQAPSLPSPAPAYGQGKPVVRWVGHTRIEPGQNVRPS